MKMKRKREYTKPVSVPVALDFPSVLANVSIPLQQDYETEEACSKNHVFDNAWEDNNQDNE